MAGAGVPAGCVDLLEDYARGGESEPAAAVLLRDQGGEPALLGERGDELLRVTVRLEVSPVLAREALAELADGGADLLQLVRNREVHQPALRPVVSDTGV